MWKSIIKGEEIHPSVKGFETQAKAMFAKLRKNMSGLKEDIEKIEELKDTDDWEKTPKIVQDRLLLIVKKNKEKIEEYGKIIGSKFNPKHSKYDTTVNQRLTPTTKKPQVKRMKRPFAYSYDPNEKDMDKILMRRFDFSEEQYKELSPEVRQDLMNVYEMTKD